MSVNIRDQAVLASALGRLEELTAACRARGPLYCRDSALTNDVVRKAKGLRTALGKLRAALDDPHHRPGAEAPAPARADGLALRVCFQRHLTELVRYLSYGGKREQEFWDHYTEMCRRYGQGRMSEAYQELCEADTSRLPAVIRLRGCPKQCWFITCSG
jgi:hypothetical protein